MRPPGRAGRLSSRQGGAVIEMIGIVPIFVIFMIFTVTACRWLVFQGRILAAGRTTAWLVSHADSPGKAGGFVSTPEFGEKLRDWHFSGSGVVVVEAPQVNGGLLGGGDIEEVMTQMEQIGQKKGNEPSARAEYERDRDASQNDYRSDVEVVEKSETTQREKTREMTGEGRSASMVARFMESVIQYLTADFKRTEVRVHYWMPLLFNLEAFEKLLGAPLDHGEAEPEGTQAAMDKMGKAGQQYALLTRGRHTRCSFPILDPGRGGGVGEAIGEAITKVEEMLEKVQEALKGSSDTDLYRPMKGLNHPGGGGQLQEPDGDQDEVLQPEFYALLVYEWMDPLHKGAKPWNIPLGFEWGNDEP